MNDTEKISFKPKWFNSIEELDNEESAIGKDSSPSNILCLAVQLDKFDVQASDFNVSVRVAPQFL